MRVWGIINKNHKIIASATAQSLLEDTGKALLECLEQIYKELDIAEPVWVSGHTRDLSAFRKTKFLPSDFIEPVSFDFFEIEILPDSET